MRKNLLLILFSLITLISNAQTDNKIIIGKVDSVYSAVLNEKRKVWVYVPDMSSGMQNTGQRFPVLYLLDGDAHFPSVAGMIQQLSQINGNTICPEMIVVGIPNTDRTRDLTPTPIKSDLPMMDSNSTKTTGG
ncbi:MAG TPA: alpha/beta hydrolase-fold protein, partial [Chitinophagaceae bacterium]|nr:alpha/beta hydrolase-fold protein [Chitinophagaceae bacterium]